MTVPYAAIRCPLATQSSADSFELIGVIRGLSGVQALYGAAFRRHRMPAIHLKTENMYHWGVKQVVLAILIVIAAQPLQASFCGMDMGQVAQRMMDVGGSDSDCCDHEQPGSTDSCDPLMHCGAVPAGVAVLDTTLDSRIVPVTGNLPWFRNRPLSPSFDSPLYRPPIS